MWLEEGREPPPVRLTRAGETLYVRDGRHRITAARVAGHVLIEAEVRDSSRRQPAGARRPLPLSSQMFTCAERGGPWASTRSQHVHLASVW